MKPYIICICDFRKLVKVNLKLPLRPQDSGGVRNKGHLSRKAVGMEKEARLGNNLCAVGDKTKGVWVCSSV